MLERLKHWSFWVTLFGGLLALAPQIFDALGFDQPKTAKAMKWVGVASSIFGLLNMDPVMKKAEAAAESVKLLVVALLAGSLLFAASSAEAAEPAGDLVGSIPSTSPSDTRPHEPIYFYTQSATPPAAPAKADQETPPIEKAEKLLSKLKCHAGAGICPSMPLTATAFGLDGQFHALNVGAGFGIDVPFEVRGVALAAGLAVAPLIELDHKTQQGVFSLLLHLDVYEGGGFGLLWRAVEIGGDQPGLHPFHRSQLFGVLTFDLLQAI